MKPPKVNWKELPLIAEPLSNAGPERLACSECKLGRGRQDLYTLPFVPKDWTGNVLAVKEYTEPLVLESFLAEGGLNRKDVAVVNACRCVPSKPTMRQIKACRPFLLQVINKLKPRNVLAFGKVAMRAVTGDGKMHNLTKNRGLQLPIPGAEKKPSTVNATFSPMTENLYHAQFIVEDIQKLSRPALEPPAYAVPSGSAVAFDTEYTKFPERKMLNLATASTRSAVSYAPGHRFVPAEIANATWAAGHSITGDLDQLLKQHWATNSKYDQNLERWLQGDKVIDSLIYSRMENENRDKGGYELETLLRSYFRVNDSWKAETTQYGDYAEDWPADLREKRCRYDAWATAVLCRYLADALPSVPAIRFNHQIAQTMHRMGLAAARVNVPYYKKVRDEQQMILKRQDSKLVRIAHSYGMTEYSPTNDNHIRELVYTHLGKPVTEMTEKGNKPKVDKITLAQHIEDPTVALQMEYNVTQKLSSSLDGLEKYMVKHDTQTFLHFSINALGARTGRRSSGGGDSTFNSQNWAEELRRMVVSRFPHGRIVSADQSRVEVRLIAYVSKCERLLDYFANGDGYIGVGHDLFKTDVVKGTPLYRATKSIVLGINYNMADYKLAWDLWYRAGVKLHSNWDRHREIAARLRQQYFQLYPELKVYMEDRERELRQTHQVVGVLGQTRRLPLSPEPPRSEQQAYRQWRRAYKHSLNQAINFPIQWFSAVVTGCCALDIESELLNRYRLSYTDYQRRLLCRDYPEMPLMFNEVHDELDFDVPGTKRSKSDVKMIEEIMTCPPTLHKLIPDFECPLKAEIVEAPYWKK